MIMSVEDFCQGWIAVAFRWVAEMPRKSLPDWFWLANAGRAGYACKMVLRRPPVVDPWKWRMRVLEERDDIAYAKVFFKTSGFITKEWYPLSTPSADRARPAGWIWRRQDQPHVKENLWHRFRGASHSMRSRRWGTFTKRTRTALTELWSNYRWACTSPMIGHRQKRNRFGREYGRNSTVFTNVKNSGQSEDIPYRDWWTECYEKICQQILWLNPAANEKTIRKFITGLWAILRISFTRVQSQCLSKPLAKRMVEVIPESAARKMTLPLSDISIQELGCCKDRNSSTVVIFSIVFITIPCQVFLGTTALYLFEASPSGASS